MCQAKASGVVAKLRVLKMWKIVCSVGFLHLFLDASRAQVDNCDYFQYLGQGESYSVISPHHPKNYNGENHCNWVTTTNGGNLLEGNCTISLPYSYNCLEDAVTIQYPNNTSRRYCGFQTLNFAEPNIIKIQLDSPFYSRGGQFSCDIKVSDPNDEGDERDYCKCGRINRERIVGGITTGVNDYPMMAGMVDASKGIIYCGATIINNKQVITAASCLLNVNWKLVGVVVGEHDVTKGKETNATVLFRIANVFFPPYPQYNNIAVVTILGTIEFNDAVGPVCLPFQHAPDTFAGQYVDVLGWGRVELNGRKARRLKRVYLSVLTNKDCSRYYFGLQHYQMCTHTLARDVCEYDTGGPLLWRNPATKRMVLTGVLANANTCNNGIPAISTRIGVFINWILSVTAPGVKYCIEE